MCVFSGSSSCTGLCIRINPLESGGFSFRPRIGIDELNDDDDDDD
jgi:hypothetical protein